MKALKLFLIVLLLNIYVKISAQDFRVPEMSFPEFEKFLTLKTDTVYVINFWATWCGPCRRELPAFEKIHHDFTGTKVRVLLVSLDFPSTVDKTLLSYLRSNQITAPVILLNEPDANSWIDKVHPAWTGSLPATLIYRDIDRRFFEKELTYQEIVQSIQSFN